MEMTPAVHAEAQKSRENFKIFVFKDAKSDVYG